MDDKINNKKTNNNNLINVQIIDSVHDKFPKLNKLKIDIKKVNINEPNEQKSTNNSRSITKRKLIINLDTTVYDIIGAGENKNRNYDKITSEIKKIETKNELEKANLKKQINQITKRISDKQLTIYNKNEEEKDMELTENKLNLQSKKIKMMELERNKKINYIEIIQKLKIPPENRKIKDILRIKTFIEQSNLGKNFSEEFSDINIIEKIINFCSIEMRYEKYEKGDIIYKVGEHPNSVYSIIFGKVDIFKPIEKTQLLTGFQYFHYLMNLRKKKENYLFNLSIKKNTANYYIEQTDADIIHFIYLINYLEYIRTKNDIKLELDKILDLINIKPEEIGIEKSKINSNTYINNNLKLIKKRIPFISETTIQKYSFINNYVIKKEIIIYEYNQILSLKANDYFGDNDIENHTIRNTTAIAGQDLEVAYLPSKLYYIQIALLKSIALESKISTLHSSYFFNKIKYNKFSKKYYKLFINERYSKGDILFNEGTEIKYLYFIQEGNVQLYSSKSMNEIQQLINLLIEKKIENMDKPNDNYYLYNKINSKQDDIINYLNLKQNNKLIILNSNEDIGAVSYFLGNNYLVSCNVISNYAKIFKIDVNYITNMLNNEIDCNEEFTKRMNKKLELLSERLFKINNIKLIMTDERVNNEKINHQTLEEKKKILLKNNQNNKTLINYNKINNLVTENNNNNNISKLDQKKNPLDLPILYSNKRNNPNNSFFNNNITELNDSNLIKKTISKKKVLIFEDNIIKKINQDFNSFIQNKYSLTKRKIRFNNSNKSLKDSKNKTEGINSINNNSAEKTKRGEKDIFNNSYFNNISSSSTQKIDKLEKSNRKIPNIFKNPIKFDLRSLSNNYKKNNIINKYRNEKKYNHPYYEKKTLFKMEKYKIFDYYSRNKAFQNELLKTQIQRKAGLKNLYLTMNN